MQYTVYIFFNKYDSLRAPLIGQSSKKVTLPLPTSDPLNLDMYPTSRRSRLVICPSAIEFRSMNPARSGLNRQSPQSEKGEKLLWHV